MVVTKFELHNIRFTLSTQRFLRKDSQSMTENDLSYKIIGLALDIHKTLGPGLLESVYETAFGS